MPSGGVLMGRESGKYWKPPHIFEGRDIFVLGGGPSLKHIIENPELLTGKNVLAVHYAFLAFPVASVWFMGDARCWWELKDQVSYAYTLKISANRRTKEIQSVENAAGMKIVECVKGKGLSPINKGFINYNGSAGGAAIDLAATFGAKRIIMYGFDGNTLPLQPLACQSTHTRQSIVDKWKNDLTTWGAVHHDATKRGIELVNCTPNSNMPVVPKRNLEDCL